MNEISENANHSIVTVLIGNKSDLDERVILTTEGSDFARDHGLIFLETSALSGQNVHEAFHSAAAEVVDRVKCGEIKVDGPSQFSRRTAKPKVEKRGCCS